MKIVALADDSAYIYDDKKADKTWQEAIGMWAHKYHISEATYKRYVHQRDDNSCKIDSGLAADIVRAEARK